MKKTLLAMACGLGSLVACSSSNNDICAAYFTKVNACPVPDAGILPDAGVPDGGVIDAGVVPTQATCETGLSSSACADSADQTAIPLVTNCLNAIPACMSFSTFELSALSCLNQDGGSANLAISVNCLKAAGLYP